MKFEDFIKSGQVRKAKIDISLAKSLFNKAKSDSEFFDSILLTELSARKLVSNYYDILRSILEAIAILNGYKIYGHEAFTYYLKILGEDNLSVKFDRLRIIRNKINYYGKDVQISEAEDYIKELKEIADTLINKYLKHLRD